MNPQENSQDMNFESDAFKIATEDFKGLNPDLWIEIAVRQCLAAGLIDEIRYTLSVDNLECVMITKLDATYFAEIEKARSNFEGQMRPEKVEVAVSKFKFKQLISLIGRKRPEETTLEI